MLNIINDIVSISKIESGLVEVDDQETDINEQLNQLYFFFKPEADQKGLGFSCDKPSPDTRSTIITDQGKLHAVLSNLIKNTLKFTSEGTVEFGFSDKGQFLEFFVKDDGPGIPAAQHDIVFERFRQGNEYLTRNYEGAGLGLSISKAYIEMLGGKIWVDSEVGKGSVFYLSIPFDRKQQGSGGFANQTVAYDRPDVKVPGQIRKLKILITEDDDASDMLIRMIVRDMGREILSARTGMEAVDLCSKNPDTDLILMDIKMPEMDGYEATRKIRQFNSNVVIIAQTAFAFSGDRDKALDAGCDDYITKPISRSQLKQIILKHFSSGKPKRLGS